MAIDMPRLIAAMKDALLRELGGEIDLIIQYGSHLKGAAHPYSDLDLSYVPAHESTWKSITVVVAGVMCDLYPIHWSRLEEMADFRDPSGTVLLDHRVLYQRNEEAAARLAALPSRLLALLQPEARPAMLRRAQEIFRATGYDYFLLGQQAAAGHPWSCLQHADRLLRRVLHCLAVCNQACIDTRKLPEILALPRLPAGIAETAARITSATDPGELLAACGSLMQTTRDLLLAEQRQIPRQTTLPALLDSAYPELKGDLQHVLLACERRDMFSLKGPLLSLYHELNLALAQAFTGIAYSDFNSLTEYEQNLVALGFPALLPHVVSGDFVALHRACLAFDQHLQRFLRDHAVQLNAFDSIDALQEYLDSRTLC